MFNPNFSKLLVEVLNNPGKSSDTYNRFYHYSFTNRMLFMMQGLNEPVATYAKWQELGRQVRKGESAKYLWVPKIKKEKDGTSSCYGFMFRKGIFGLSQTDGPELEYPETKEWNKDDCLNNLGVKLIKFEADGNVQGYCVPNIGIAINPVAKYPIKTLLHEIAHYLMGHKDSNSVSEFQAETVAYILMHELGIEDKFDKAASRAYIQGWLDKELPSQDTVKQVFQTINKVIEAGKNE